MAENTNVPKAGNTGKRFSKFFREIKSELKKVIWPTRDQLVNNTITVVAACLVIGALIWVADLGLGRLVDLVLLK